MGTSKSGTPCSKEGLIAGRAAFSEVRAGSAYSSDNLEDPADMWRVGCSGRKHDDLRTEAISTDDTTSQNHDVPVGCLVLDVV